MLNQAQEASQVAMNDLVQAARRAQTQPGARDELPQFQARAQAASKRVQQLLDAQRGSPQFQSKRQVLPEENEEDGRLIPYLEKPQGYRGWERN